MTFHRGTRDQTSGTGVQAEQRLSRQHDAHGTPNTQANENLIMCVIIIQTIEHWHSCTWRPAWYMYASR